MVHVPRASRPGGASHPPTPKKKEQEEEEEEKKRKRKRITRRKRGKNENIPMIVKQVTKRFVFSHKHAAL